MRTVRFTLSPEENDALHTLCGQLDQHLNQIERQLAVEISHRGHAFKVFGPETQVSAAKAFISDAYNKALNDEWDTKSFHVSLNALSHNVPNTGSSLEIDHRDVIKTSLKQIEPKSANQKRYVRRVKENDISFGIGPAGTGKTYLAVACAVQAFDELKAKRILLVRPAVEAGESLGFLPGDLMQKVDPYLRPMYDALYELMGIEKVHKLIQQQVIEVAPLAYMRGRTLNDAYIILDESQNTTREQMKMFLTRIGFNSKAIITGDITQVDLPKGKTSGLRHAIGVLSNVDGISFTFFERQDVVRHPLVQKVVAAYEEHESQEEYA